MDRTGGPPVGRHRTDQHQHGQADQDDRTPDAHPIHAADERGDADSARPYRGREEQGPAQPGQGQQGPIGLTQKHAAQGEAAEGPRHADGLGQGEGGHVGGGATAPWGGEPRRRGHEEGFDQDEHECAVPIERPGPHEPQGEAADTGPPPRPQSRRARAERPDASRAARRRPDPGATTPTAGGKGPGGVRRPETAAGSGHGAPRRSRRGCEHGRVRGGPSAGDAGGDAHAAIGRPGHGHAAESGHGRLDTGGP